ncbi:MAG: chemotaxis protein CheB, partial [Lachnospiraceae bacterium]
MQKIKVVVLDDSLFYREAIQQKLQQDVNIQVVGKASNPYAARDLIVEHLPDLLIADVNLGKMSGTEFIEQLLPQYFLPVIMISSDVGERAASLSHNIIDFIPKPGTTTLKNNDEFFHRLLITIREGLLKEKPMLSFSQLSSSVVAIGASTGGTDAIETLIQTMPAIMPPTVISQHMSAGFTASFAERLNRKYNLSIKEAADGDILIPGQVYIAPGNYDMTIVKKNQGLGISIQIAPEDRKAHPNVDLLLRSVARSKVTNAVGILLTGMGKDGAYGLQAMHQARYATIVQDKGSSVVYG